MSVTQPVKGKTAIITGAGSGINLAFANLLLENGCNVVIADLGLRPEAQAVVNKFNGRSGSARAIFQKTDVTDWVQLEELFVVAEKEFTEIISFVLAQHWSNFWRPPGSSESRDDPKGGRYRLLDINITHPIRVTQLAISHFLQHQNSNKRKHIVHISSIAGQNPSTAAPIYVATKHAISGLVRSLAKLDKEFGIRVTAVAPGLIKTPLWMEHPEKLKMFKEGQDVWVTPEEVGEVMLALVQQEEVSEIIGDREGKGVLFPVEGGTILEVSKTVRAVHPFNDPGPSNRAGNTVANAEAVENEIYDLLSTPGWGKANL
uniref:15-hydroxyprostaglandin dehydrogenase [NAD(+)] n=1 Tax=Talaromyces marneffei PM1 TaxID=1077442 RepID=A0A093V1C0_TALMA